MTNLTQNHIKWISHFSKEQFDKVVIKYLEEVLEIKDYVNTDGTNDGGNDIRIFVNGEKLKIAFQITVQESSIEKKIREDLEKTRRNVQQYGYQKSLHFFYSQPVSEEKVNEYELIAQKDFDLKLYLIDAKKIAYTAAMFPALLKEINNIYGIEINESKSLSEADRMLYDFYSFGSSATEIKNQIIKSFIVHKLFEKGSAQKDEMFEVFNKHFESTDKALFNKVISQLINDKRVVQKGGILSLTMREEKRINVVKEQFNFQEHELYRNLNKILDDNCVDKEYVNEIVMQLKVLFESNFKADKLDVLDQMSQVDQDPVSEGIGRFYRFIKSISNDSKAKKIVKELIEICKDNDIIQKLSAGKIFTSFVNPDVIRNYINQSERLVFFDTPVILYTLCLYSYEVNSKNYYYNSVKDLFKIKEQNKSLKYKVYRDYIPEVSYHLREALLLVDFDKADLMQELGGSNNVFYNFYLFLKDESLLEEHCSSFEDYLYDSFELSPIDINANYFYDKAAAKIKECLYSLSIDIFERNIRKELYQLAKSCIEESLQEKERYRSQDSVGNDSYMLATLFDDQISVNEPILVTWDLNFLSARKKYHQRISASRLWHWFTPDRLHNHFSLLNFNLNSNTITRDILTVIDEKFNLYKKAQSLLDTVSKLVNIKTETGRKYINAIKEFKRDYIYEINTKHSGDFVEEEKRVYPIQEVMFSLVKHYYANSDGLSIDDFKLVFQTEIIYEEVIQYFKEELNYFMDNKKQSDAAFERMNGIVKKAKEIKLTQLSTPDL